MLEKLIIERTKLINTITEFHALFKTKEFQNLSDEDYKILDKQERCMFGYSDTLLERINKLK